MATDHVLTTYYADGDLETVEVEHCGQLRTFEFTDLVDLQIDLHRAGMPGYLVREVASDVERARANGWTSDDFCDSPPEPDERAPCHCHACREFAPLSWRDVANLVVGSLAVFGGFVVLVRWVGV